MKIQHLLQIDQIALFPVQNRNLENLMNICSIIPI